MPTRRELALEQLLQSYTTYFNVARHEPSEREPWQAEAEYYSRDEKYVLTPKAKMWAAESNEYAYFFTVGQLTQPLYQQLRDAAVRHGFGRVIPHSEHMCSNISLLFVAEQIDAEALAQLKAERLRKNYLFSIHGWAELRVACLELATNSCAANRAGQELLPILTKTVERVAEIPAEQQPLLP